MGWGSGLALLGPLSGSKHPPPNPQPPTYNHLPIPGLSEDPDAGDLWPTFCAQNWPRYEGRTWAGP